MSDEKEKKSKNTEKMEELKKELFLEVQKYIDSKLNPVLKYFERKKDYHEMNFL